MSSAQNILVAEGAPGSVQRLRRWLRPCPWLRGLVFWGGAVATGATAVAFARGSDAALTLFHWGAHRSALWSWLAPPCGLALVAWLGGYPNGCVRSRLELRCDSPFCVA